MGKSNISARRIFTREFKLAAVKELDSGKGAGLVARRLEINENLLYRWRQEFNRNPTRAFAGPGNKIVAESKEAELERKIGQMTMEIDFLKKLLRTFEERREADGGGRPFMRKSAKKASR
jgi:transposase-like protein